MNKPSAECTKSPVSLGSTKHEFLLKRVYDPASAEDGFRCLVDRLWPRGVKKEAFHLTRWMKDLAPSPPLRTWFGHEPAKWGEFRSRYRAELKNKSEMLEPLLQAVKKQNVTLLYAARDPQINHALVLKQFLDEKKGGSASKSKSKS